MKSLWISVAIGVLILGIGIGGRWAFFRLLKKEMASKEPRTGVVTVVKKEHVRLSNGKTTVTLPNGDVKEYRDEKWYIYFRMDEFYDVDAIAREAIAERERRRFAKDGPRRIEVPEDEFRALKEGDKTVLKYAYYPNVFWGTSGHIRVPW